MRKYIKGNHEQINRSSLTVTYQINLMAIIFHNPNVFDLLPIDKGHQIEFLNIL